MDIEPIFNALQMRNWYAVAALVLTLVIQVIRKNPGLPVLAKLKALWNKTPNGLRWVWPATGGAATAFVGAFQAGVEIRGALMAALGGVISIGIGAMGLNALLTELPISWNGGAGGQPPGPKKGSDVLRGLPTAGLCCAILVFVVGCGGTALRDVSPIGVATASTLCKTAHAKVKERKAADVLSFCAHPENLQPWFDLAADAEELAKKQAESFTKPEAEDAKPDPVKPEPVPAPPPVPPSEPSALPPAPNEA
jgi:hypothetical protein